MSTMINNRLDPAFTCKDWQTASEQQPNPASLIIQLRQEIYLLPYFTFRLAHGNNSKVDLYFSEKTVSLTGHGLAALLYSIATHRVTVITQPSENEAKFGVRGQTERHTGPSVTTISVTDADQDVD